MKFKLSKRSSANLLGVHANLVSVVEKSIEITPIDFGVLEGLRTEKRQAELYKQKKSKLDGVKRLSMHQLGQAIDIVVYPEGKLSWEVEDYIPVLEVFRQIGIKEGYKLRFGICWLYGHKINSIREGYEYYLNHNGKFVDAVHIEYKGLI